MNTELTPPTTQAKALELLDKLYPDALFYKDKREEKVIAHLQLQELIRLLLPE